MFQRYKEIWYGVLFGLGAVAIDLLMHSRLQGRSLLEELITIEPVTLIYRLLFLGFGIGSGLLMWRNAKREREFRRLEAEFSQLKSQLSPLATVIYSKLQLVLTRPDADSLSPALKELLQSIHTEVRRLKSAL